MAKESSAVVSVLSLALVAAAILGVVLIVSQYGTYCEKHPRGHVSTNTKAADGICKPTEYKDACKRVMYDVADNASATYKDYLLAIFQATGDELEEAIGTIDRKSPSNPSADLKTCRRMLGYAHNEMQQVIKVVAKTKEASLLKQVDTILVWLTAIRAYQTTCIDEIGDERIKKDMLKTLHTAKKLTFDAEKIVYNTPKILKEVGPYLGDAHPPSTGHRMLLEEVHAMDHDGFPSWVSSADRKLLGADNKKTKGHPFSERMLKTPPPPPLPPTVEPNAVVAKDGSGKFKSIQEALDAYPPNHQGRYIIHIKAGVYDEGQIVIGKNKHNVYMYGDGHDKTIITGNLNHGFLKIGTSQTATVLAIGERFMAKGIGFRNTIGPAGHQAVAFRSQSPHTVMMDCSFEGYQNTLYYHTHEQFYKNCIISGTVDFIFGSGRAYIQNSQIYVRKPNPEQANTITADGRMKHEEIGGVVLHNCTIRGTPELEPAKAQIASYLGRPWKGSATSVIMKSDIGDVIRPEGWSIWESEDGMNNHKTCRFREYENTGPGSNTKGRVKWPSYKILKDDKEAAKYTAGKFMQGGYWLRNDGVSANLGL